MADHLGQDDAHMSPAFGPPFLMWLFFTSGSNGDVEALRWLTSASAIQIAVMRESDARGPFCSTVMAVVVVKDVLLFVCLAINLEFANMVSGSCV